MKQVTALHLLASPEQTGQRVETEVGEGIVYNDGSVIVPSTGAIFAPESGDGELWEMRCAFDRMHGISVTQRLTLPVLAAHQGERVVGNYA